MLNHHSLPVLRHTICTDSLFEVVVFYIQCLPYHEDLINTILSYNTIPHYPPSSYSSICLNAISIQSATSSPGGKTK